MREPMAVAGAAVVAGALAWPWWQPGFGSSLGAALALVGLALLGRQRQAAWLALAAACFLLGTAAAASRPPPRPLGARAAIQGVVEEGGTWQAVVGTGAGRVRLQTPQPLRVGQRILALTVPDSPRPVLPGELGTAPDDLRAAQEPRRALALAVLPDARAAPAGLARLALTGHPGLLRALATGDRSGVRPQDQALLRRTGTAHLLAISGLHVGLLAAAVGGVAWVLTRPLALSRAWRLARLLPALAACAAAVAYAVDVGAPASARRAAVMVVAAAGTTLLGRRPRPWTLLGLAAAGVSLVRPGLVGELGFQLSFSAVVGMLLVGPRLARLVPPDSPRWLRWLVASLGATFGATAGTLPLVAWHFQQLAPLAPLANLIAGPLVGGVAVPAVLLGLRLPGDAGLLCLAVADSALDLCLRGLALLDRPPWALAVGPVGALLLAFAVLARKRPALAAGLALLALGLRELPRGRLVVTFLSIGQGDAALVEWPDGRRWLVDGGPASDRVLQYLRRRGIRSLDAVVLSHAHPDHYGGLLPVLQELSVHTLWVPRPPERGESDYLALWQRAWQQHATIVLPDQVPAQGWPGVRVDHPRSGWHARGSDRLNEESLVLRLQLGAHSVLMAGDVEEDAERLLAAMLPPVTLVKVPHHGSRSSSSEGMVAATRPAVAVISCGRGNRFGHPNLEPLAHWSLPAGPRAALPRCGSDRADGTDWGDGTGGCAPSLLRTDVDGTVEWSTDGHRWRLRTWRPDRGWRLRSSAPAPALRPRLVPTATLLVPASVAALRYLGRDPRR